jgi:hypothetical protein
MARIALVRGEDGGWYLPDCLCRFDYFDGKPVETTWPSGDVTLRGVVAPHVHECDLHSGGKE